MKPSQQRYVVFIAAMAVLLAGTLAWLGHGRLKDYRQYHHVAAGNG